MNNSSSNADANLTDAQPKTPDDLPPAQAREAERIMRTMPEGADPSPAVRERSRWWLYVLSALLFGTLVGIVVTTTLSASTMLWLLVITLAYGIGLLPLIGAAMLRRKDARESVRRARRST